MIGYCTFWYKLSLVINLAFNGSSFEILHARIARLIFFSMRMVMYIKYKENDTLNFDQVGISPICGNCSFLLKSVYESNKRSSLKSSNETK